MTEAGSLCRPPPLRRGCSALGVDVWTADRTYRRRRESPTDWKRSRVRSAIDRTRLRGRGDAKARQKVITGLSAQRRSGCIRERARERDGYGCSAAECGGCVLRKQPGAKTQSGEAPLACMGASMLVWPGPGNRGGSVKCNNMYCGYSSIDASGRVMEYASSIHTRCV